MAFEPGEGMEHQTLLLVSTKPRLMNTVEQRIGPGFTCIHMLDSREALAWAAQNRVDCGIIEADLPHLSGPDLILGIRQQQPRFGGILLGKKETFATARQALQVGAWDVISHPWRSRDIAQSLFQSLRNRVHEENRSMGMPEGIEDLALQLESLSVSEAMARTQNDIYAGIIHDIASPISVAQGYLNLLNISLAEQKRVSRKGMEKFIERLDKIAHQIQVCSDITRRQSAFINFSQSTSGRTLELSNFLEELAGVLAVHPKLRKVKVEVSIPTDEITLSFHRVDLLQVILNLVQNAIYASDKDTPIEVGMVTDQKPGDLLKPAAGTLINTIHFHNVSTLENPIILQVKDSGTGIPAELIDLIFQKSVTTKPPHEGSGLGLSIVDRLVSNSGGSVVVHSRPGEGTTFYLILPRV